MFFHRDDDDGDDAKASIEKGSSTPSRKITTAIPNTHTPWRCLFSPFSCCGVAGGRVTERLKAGVIYSIFSAGPRGHVTNTKGGRFLRSAAQVRRCILFDGMEWIRSVGVASRDRGGETDTSWL
jgi:hypothetical protein